MSRRTSGRLLGEFAPPSGACCTRYSAGSGDRLARECIARCRVFGRDPSPCFFLGVELPDDVVGRETKEERKLSQGTIVLIKLPYGASSLGRGRVLPP